jgi:hypothetical protein
MLKGENNSSTAFSSIRLIFNFLNMLYVDVLERPIAYSGIKINIPL